MKHSALKKNAFIEILKTKSRFLSIFGIVAIGVAFFAGVKGASPDMKISADTYFDNNRLMDYRLVSTLGFDEEDIKAIENADENLSVYPSYFVDVLLKSEKGNRALRVEAMVEGVNSLTLKEGRFPEKENECIIMGGGMAGGYSVGDVLTLSSGTDSELSETLKNTEFTVVGKYNSPQYIDKSTIGNTTVGSGSINAVVYIPTSNFDVEYYTEVYVVADNFTEYNTYGDEYKELSEKLGEILEDVGKNRAETRYVEIIDEANEKIADAEQELKDKTADADKEFEEAWQKLEDAKKELDEGETTLADSRKELDDAKEQLESSRTELDEGWEEYYSAKAEFEQKITDGENEIEKNRADLEDGKQKYKDGLAEYKDGLAQYSEGLAKYKDGLEQYKAGLEEWNAGYAEFEPQKQQYDEGLAAYNDGMAQLEALQVQLNETLAQLEEMKAAYGENNPIYLAAKEQYDNGVAAYETNYMQLAAAKAALDRSAPQIEAAEAQFAEGKAKLDESAAELEAAKAVLEETKVKLDSAKETLDESKKQLEDGEKQLDEGEKELEKAKNEGLAQLKEAYDKLNDGETKYADGLADYNEGEEKYAEGKAEYEQGVIDYKDGIDEYNKNKKEYKKEVAEAEDKIADAKREIEDISDPKWYVFDRTDNAGYTEYGENAERINNIASIFPIFFILVAGLVCLTTMTRMVEEERVQIGTLKALGYSNSQIIFKYMLYAIAATIAGCIAGVLIGEKIFPYVIIVAYGMLYNMPELCLPYDWSLGAIAAVVGVAAVIITVYFSCRTELKEQPAQLMRPKPPKSGKRVFLEKIPFIWNHMNFSSKITARNIFRYKRRMLMTVIGIAGCTALMLMGFGLKDSVSDILGKQFNDINKYSGIVAYDSDEITHKTLVNVQNTLNNEGSSLKVYEKQLNAVFGDGRTVAAYVTVPDDSQHFGSFLTLRDRITHTPYVLDDSGVIIDEKLSRLLGCRKGDVITIKSDMDSYNVAVAEITENYANHYIYMTETLYRKLFGKVPDYNMIFFSNSIAGDSEENLLAEKLMAFDGVLAVSFNTGNAETFMAMLQALNYVIVVIIAAAGVLAFVVLYNLTNININERIREIATLKVLGFYDKEVDSYIFRENIILSFLGSLVGLVLGTYLAQYIIQTAEVDLVMFGREVYPLSYILAAALTIGFSLIVSLFMHKRLIKVNMIEALKSVE